MLKPGFDSITVINSKMNVNSRVNMYICCFSMCFFNLNCSSLMHDKCTVLTYIYVTIYHSMQYVTALVIIVYCTGMHTYAYIAHPTIIRSSELAAANIYHNFKLD